MSNYRGEAKTFLSRDKARIRGQLLSKFPGCCHCGDPCLNKCPGCQKPIHLTCIFHHSDGCKGPSEDPQ